MAAWPAIKEVEEKNEFTGYGRQELEGILILPMQTKQNNHLFFKFLKIVHSEK